MTWKPPTLALLALFWVGLFLDQGRSMAEDGVVTTRESAPRRLEASTWYLDHDGDGYGDPGQTFRSVAAPAGYVDDGTDCDDTEVLVHPGATEICNGRDDDCDGIIDESSAIDATPWHLDADGDGFGDPDVRVETCNPPLGFVADSGDCDDSRPSVHPGASEICDGIDNDCDDYIDDSSAKDAVTWYRDQDGDQHGAAGTGIVRCEQPSGFVSSDDDCDDHHADLGTDAGGCEPGPEATSSGSAR
jgi:large repetitive protein